MDSSDDEEERLRRWKEHLAAQQTDDEDDGPPPASALSARRPESSTGRVLSARRPPEHEYAGSQASAPRDSLDAAAQKEERESIDWMSAMMPQMRQLQHDKEALETRLKEQQRLISRLQQQNQDLNQSADDGAPMDQKESKIVELAKKNRALTLALDKEKAKSGRTAAELKRAQQELDAANRARDQFAGMDARSLPKEQKVTKEVKAQMAFGQKAPDSIPENDQTPEDKVKELTSKVAALNGQVNSQRLVNERLKQENGKVKEALKRELGDVPVDTALRALEGGAAAAGWTGRAQTISLLQSKIVELKRELAVSLESKLSPGASPKSQQSQALDVASPGGAKAALQLDAASRLDAQHRRQIDKIERDRRFEASSLQEQMDKERADKAALKRKLDAAASRVSVLENEVRDMRDKIQVLLSKTDNDDALISALQTEMAAMARAAKDNKRARRDETKHNLDSASSHSLEQIEEKQAQIERQHKIILSLRAELQVHNCPPPPGGGSAQFDGLGAARWCLWCCYASSSNVLVCAMRDGVDVLRCALGFFGWLASTDYAVALFAFQPVSTEGVLRWVFT